MGYLLNYSKFLFFRIFLILIGTLLLPKKSCAQTEFADVLLDSFYSNALAAFDDFFGIVDGNVLGGCSEELISPSVCLGNNESYVCLPKGSYVTVGFLDNFIIDAPNQNDIFIEETFGASEIAEVFVSSDLGKNFTFLGEIDGGTTNELDLKDISIKSPINAIKIVGTDNKGCTPGFDLVKVYGIEGANCKAKANILNPPIICNNIGKFDLDALVMGDTSGHWIGPHVIGSEFNPEGFSGVFNLQYVVKDENSLCPSDTAFISIIVEKCIDCNGIPYGSAEIDECGECLEPSDPNFNKSCADCVGVTNGSAIIDDCGSLQCSKSSRI